MTIEEKNIVLAEFMGIDVHKLSFLKDPTYVRVILGKEEDFDWDSIHDFDPHRDYNWLMKAWVKFRDIRFKGGSNNPAYWEAGLWEEKIGSAILRKPILEAFEALYKAVNWYNSLKK